MVFFQQTGTHGNKPTCATQDRWAISHTTPAGQAMVSALLTAFASNNSIIIYGTGDCSAWGDTESVAGFVIPN